MSRLTFDIKKHSHTRHHTNTHTHTQTRELTCNYTHKHATAGTHSRRPVDVRDVRSLCGEGGFYAPFRRGWECSNPEIAAARLKVAGRKLVGSAAGGQALGFSRGMGARPAMLPWPLEQCLERWVGDALLHLPTRKARSESTCHARTHQALASAGLSALECDRGKVIKAAYDNVPAHLKQSAAAEPSSSPPSCQAVRRRCARRF